MSFPRPILLLVAIVLAAPALAAPARTEPDPQRIEQVAAMLPAKPAGVGRPVADRAYWARWAQSPAGRSALSRAVSLLGKPLPPARDDLFLDFSTNGNRTRWQKAENERRDRLTPLVMAECIENQGRFLPAIRELVASLCAEKTWVMSAHDRSLANFKGKTIDIDLGASALGWDLATADWLLGDRLGAETRTLIRDNVQKRILTPYLDVIDGRRNGWFWVTGDNNWNAVCHAGVVGAALAQLEDRTARARFILSAEEDLKRFLSGFTADGYCSEGLGYWNYGFGHYALLSETLRLSTGGKMELLTRPESRMPARFGQRIQIMNGISPAFADCSASMTPAPLLMTLISRRLGLAQPAEASSAFQQLPGELSDAMLYAATDEGPASRPAAVNDDPLRTWFDSGGVLIGRPAANSACRMGVALKGGNNAENHNHNDLGSYVVVVGSRAILLDPGPETYTARTFSGRRYDSKLLSSFGHAVPVIGGQLQRVGREARAQVLESTFTSAQDTLKLDLTSAYALKDLRTLQRTFTYRRTAAGSLTITDEVSFSVPQTFATALITRGQWKQLDARTLLVTDEGEAVRIRIDAGKAPFTIESEQINEEAPVHPTRIAITLKDPVADARVTLTIEPAPAPAP